MHSLGAMLAAKQLHSSSLVLDYSAAAAKQTSPTPALTCAGQTWQRRFP